MDPLEDIALAVRSSGGVAKVDGERFSASHEDVSISVDRTKKNFTIVIAKAGAKKDRTVPNNAAAIRFLRQLVFSELHLVDPSSSDTASLRHLEDTHDA